MDSYELFKVLNRGYPFIYSAPKIGVKYIGLSLFRDCSQEEAKLFKDFSKEIEKVRELDFTPEKKDVLQLIVLLNEILTRGYTEYNEDNAQESATLLWECMQDLSANEIEMLSKQHDALIEAFDYRDEAFYRHSAIV